MTPYDPPNGTTSGLAPHAETLPPCHCDECRREQWSGALASLRAVALLPIDPDGDARVERMFTTREVSKRTRPLRGNR